ncbi:hypothetical protein [Peribacillus simplex]|uniref:hypothetical protein n=1 Tax=Peribacillus simplex TaxID=1478 RepID=UPI00366E7301
MRLGEMLALKWTDLDLTKKTIRIPKTKKSIRTIMIDDGLVALFKAHKREQMVLEMKQRLVESSIIPTFLCPTY